MDKALDILKSEDADCINAESHHLLIRNANLRKLMGLMQENLELVDTLRDHEKKIRCRSPSRQAKKNQDAKCELPAPPCPCPDPEKVKKCERIVGEMAFQLDRKILCAVFLQKQRLYGFRVDNIKEKIAQVTTCPETGKVDEQMKCELMQRYHHTMDELKKRGYNPKIHPGFTEQLVNKYGLMKAGTTPGAEEMSSMNDPRCLRKMITECMPEDMVDDILIILNCLVYFAEQSGKPLLI